MVCSNGVNFTEGVSYRWFRDFEIFFNYFHRRDVGCCSSTYNNYHKWFNIPSSIFDVIY